MTVFLSLTGFCALMELVLIVVAILVEDRSSLLTYRLDKAIPIVALIAMFCGVCGLLVIACELK